MAICDIRKNAFNLLWLIRRDFLRLHCSRFGGNSGYFSDIFSQVENQRAFGGRISICNGAWKNGWKSVLFFLRVWYTWTVGAPVFINENICMGEVQRIRGIKEVGLRYGSINRKTKCYYKM